MVQIGGKTESVKFLVGDKLSVADVLLAELLESTREALVATGGKFDLGYEHVRVLYEYVTQQHWWVEWKKSANWMPFPAPGEVGGTYVQNVRTAMS